MRVLIYDGTLNPPTFVKALATNLANEGCKVYLAGKADRYKKQNNKFQYLPMYYRSLPWLIILLIQVLVRLIVKRPNRLPFVLNISLKRESLQEKFFTFIQTAQVYLLNPSVIHIQWATHINLFKELIESQEFKFIVSFRGRLVNVSPFVDSNIADLYKEYFPKVNGFHAVSNGILKNGEKFGADRERSAIIMPAVKDDLFHSITSLYVSSKNIGILKLLSVGRFHWKKGYQYAIDACSILKSKGIKFEYTIIAGGDKEEVLFAINDLGLENEITILNNMPHSKVLESFREADVFILPSLEEGIANVALEAMTIGVPIISTDCGGMSELIEHNVNGWIVPTASSNALSNQILDFINLPTSVKESVVIKARETIEEKHLQSKQTCDMIDFYKRIINDEV